MAISSPGVGSGLDVNSIVSQLVAIEKQPLQALQTKASTLQTQLSLYGTIQSQAAALQDAATKLADPNTWKTQIATSSNSAAVGVTASLGATSTSFSVDVTQLAAAQTTATRATAVDTPIGSGSADATLTIKLGSWGASGTGSFVANGTPVNITINQADTFSTIANKINAAQTGVRATVLRSGGQERLSFQSTTTGVAAGFEISTPGQPGSSGATATDPPATAVPGSEWLDTLAFTAPSSSASNTGMQSSQMGVDASVKINGVAMSSGTNTLTNVVPGVTLSLAQLTASSGPVQVDVQQDKATIQKSIQALADAYTTFNNTIASATAYTPGSTPGPLQGDSTTVNLQSLMRRVQSSISTGSTFSRLSDIGLQIQTGGAMTVNATKMTAAMGDMANLQKFFTQDNSDTATNGFALKFRDFGKGLLDTVSGSVINKEAALNKAITQNGKDQDEVNTRAAAVEKQLRAQYSALDAQMAQMSSLSSYVTAQLAQWNKSSA